MTPADPTAPHASADDLRDPAAAAHAAPATAPPDRDLFGRTPTGRPDWSHRRGEPRQFALAWTLFLIATTSFMFLMLGNGVAFSSSIARYAVTGVLYTLMAGILLLWPMTRLAQAPPRDPLMAVVKDILVLVLPLQAILWPQVPLARWSLPLVATIAGWTALWTVAWGACLSVAFAELLRRGPDRASPLLRSMVMAALIGVCLLPALAPWLARLAPGLAGVADVLWSLGPITGLHNLIAPRTTHETFLLPLPEQTVALQRLAAIALLAWVAAIPLVLARRPAAA